MTSTTANMTDLQLVNECLEIAEEIKDKITQREMFGHIIRCARVLQLKEDNQEWFEVLEQIKQNSL